MYKDFAANMGIPFLTKSLNTILVQHIKKSLPRLNQQVKAKLADKEQELESYPSSCSLSCLSATTTSCSR